MEEKLLVHDWTMLIKNNDVVHLQEYCQLHATSIDSVIPNLGVTPIHLAVRLMCLPSLHCLIKAGAKTDIVDQKHGASLLHWACFKQSLEIVSYLRKKIFHKLPLDQQGNTILHWLCQAEQINLKLLYFLLSDKKQSLSETGKRLLLHQNKAGQTPLLIAIQYQHIEVVRYCVEQQPALLIITDHQGFNACHYAIFKNNVAILKLLLSLQPKALHERDIHGRQLLHWAAKKGTAPILYELISQGADILQQDQSFKTAAKIANEKNSLLAIWIIFTNACCRQYKHKYKEIAKEQLNYLIQLQIEFKLEWPKNLQYYVLKCLAEFPEVELFNLHGNTFCDWLKKMPHLKSNYLISQFITMLSLEHPLIEAVKNQSIDFHHLIWINKILSKETITQLQETWCQSKQKNDQIFKITLLCCDFDEAAWPLFLNLLKTNRLMKGLTVMKLTYLKLNQEQLRELIDHLPRLKQLEKISLIGVKLTKEMAQDLLKKTKDLPYLKKIILANNDIEFIDETIFEDKLQKHLNPKLTSVDITHNYFNFKKSPLEKKLYNVFCYLGEVLPLTGEAFAAAQWLGLVATPNKNIFTLTLKINQEEKCFTLHERLVLELNQLKFALNVLETSQVFAYFQQGVEMALLKRPVLRKLQLGLVAEQTQFMIQQFQHYHPKASLKYLAMYQSIFQTKPLLPVQSCLNTKLQITSSQWLVYFIAKAKPMIDLNRPINQIISVNEHAMLACEGLHKNGQRFFKVFHLINPNEKQIKIENYPIDFPKVIDHLSKEHALAIFSVDAKKVKQLLKVVIKEVNTEDHPNLYRKIILNSSKKEESTKELNCTKWVRLKFEDELNIQIIQTVGEVPSRAVLTLRNQPLDSLVAHYTPEAQWQYYKPNVLQENQPIEWHSELFSNI